VRLFVALNLPDATRARLWQAAEPLRITDLPVRWTAQEALHVTVKFLGEVAEQKLEMVQHALAEAAAPAAPFALPLAQLGAFPNLRRARVVWTGADGGATLSRLFENVERALAPLGFAREDRPYHPHVTLGRVRAGATAAQLAPLAGFAERFDFAESVTVRTLDLMRSHLGRAGARYECIAALPLGAVSPDN
jgi:2'-5' RNA ligase